MKIAIASGKGGTGKTTVATALANIMGERACLFDCDVEEPNAHIFLKGTRLSSNAVMTPLPQIDTDKCTSCGKCATFCQYGAIAITNHGAKLFPDMCHSCDGCKRICPEKAITPSSRRIGEINHYQTDELEYYEGRVDVGVPLVPPLIDALKNIEHTHQHTILDAPPGTSCPVVATLKGVDYVVMVTEPTPFGLHDLKLALDVLTVMKIPHGIIINRVTEKGTATHRLCAEKNIDVLAEIPDDRAIAESYARGEVFLNAQPQYKRLFTDIAERIFS
jgi:MinD superfamily P-loop ATPase